MQKWHQKQYSLFVHSLSLSAVLGEEHGKAQNYVVHTVLSSTGSCRIIVFLFVPYIFFIADIIYLHRFGFMAKKAVKCMCNFVGSFDYSFVMAESKGSLRWTTPTCDCAMIRCYLLIVLQESV